MIESIVNNHDSASFGSYAGHRIVYEPGSRFYNAAMNLAQMYQNMALRVDDSTYYQILNQAFYETLTDMVFSDAVEKSGYTVPPDAVNRAILYMFNDPETGRFSQKVYNETSRTDVAQARENAENYLIYQRYYYDLFGTESVETFNGRALYGLKRSAGEREALSKMGAEKHSFDAALFDASTLPANEIVKYAEAAAQSFVSYDLSVITLDDEDDCNSLLRRIQGGEITFEDAADAESQNYYSDSDGKIAGRYRWQVEDALDDGSSLSVLDALNVGELSSVIKTKRGYSVFRCDGAQTPADFTDSSIQDDVLSYINTAERGYIEDYWIGQANDFVARSASEGFDGACEAFGIEKQSTSPFPINYGGSSILASAQDLGDLSGIVSDAAVYETAFSLKLNEVSEPFVLGNNVAVLKCTGIQVDETGNVSETSQDLEIASADRSAANQAILADDKVEDNFLTTYLTLMIQQNRSGNN